MQTFRSSDVKGIKFTGSVLLLMLTGLTGLSSGAVFAADEIGPFQKTDWPCWRGLKQDGVAMPQKTPLSWSETENIAWKLDLPGRGHGSPIIVGDYLYIAVAEKDKETRSLLCVDKKSGKKIWETVVHQGKPTPPKNARGTQASSTPACDGKRLFINFLHDDAMYTSALDLDGKIIWQTRITDYVVHQGFGSSPTMYGPLVIVSGDNKSGGAIAGLDRATGKISWIVKRPEMPNYPSPIILKVAGKTQLLMTGCEMVSSFNPLTGVKNWEVEGATTECVTSTVTNGELIYTSGGYPKNHVSAVKADGSNELVWENNTRIYVPSMLTRGKLLFMVADGGFALCLDSKSGEELWKGRLAGTISSSPVLVGNKIHVTNEEGETFIFKATKDSFELLGRNKLGDECFATPTICGNQIYTRVAFGAGEERKEVLYCIAE
ncbi:MAG: PQQ-binding-like beta-propeller repeat protein [Planctomycetaceae bacterium]|nr:PQQ-binding-like beta-propeller repeat protein [Planctomycetaceae bacterium]